MIYVEYSTDGKVNYVHYMPFDSKEGLGKTSDELQQTGLLIDFVPTPDNTVGKSEVLKVNLTDKSLYYEYVDSPLTQEEKISQLESALMETTTLLAEEQAKNLQNEQAILELSMLVGGVV